MRMLQSSKPTGSLIEMPLADDGRGVAGGLQQLGGRLLGRIEPGLGAVVGKAVEMAVFARLDHRPARPADRVRHKRPVEPHPFLRHAVDIRRLVAAAVVGADRLIAVIVGEDEQDVRAVVGGGDK